MLTGRTKVLFEPWSLGDVVIAASALRLRPGQFALACHSRWHPLLRLLTQDFVEVELLPIELSYTTREKQPQAWSSLPRYSNVSEVFNIRGDIRDYRAARRVFPKAGFQISGWYGFAARRIRPLDLPFEWGWMKVRNRYRAWMELLGIQFQELEESYRSAQGRVDASGPIVLHLGAQWSSRQFPGVKKLRTALMQEKARKVLILAGPSDALPMGVVEDEVLRPQGLELIRHLRSASQVVTNDSGPMHLAAFLGCKVLAIARTSNIQEWIPPGARYVASPRMAKGYRPDKSYSSDRTLEGWPEVAEILGCF